MSDLNNFMAAIRYAESGSWEGDYQQKRRDEYHNVVVGAYGFPLKKWAKITARAGLPNAPWQSRKVQDYVAGQMMSQLFNRYGSWELAALGWMGGTMSVDRVLHRGFEGAASIRSAKLRQYVETVNTNMARVPNNLPNVAPEIKYMGGNWVFPVAGENNWKPGGFLYKRSAGAVAAGKTPVHEGIDIGAKRGTPVVAPVSGKIVYSDYGGKGGHGIKLIGDDGLTYWFSHLDGRTVQKGAKVTAGHVIGSVGNSGNAKGTSPHLHFTMRETSTRKLVNPSSYLSGGQAPPSGGFKTAKGSQETRDMMEQRLGGMFAGISSEIAGGDRVDYRTVAGEIDLSVQADQRAMEEAMQ
jgi:hypothetical protein